MPPTHSCHLGPLISHRFEVSSQVLAILGFLLLIFGILGVGLFSGSTRNRLGARNPGMLPVLWLLMSCLYP